LRYRARAKKRTRVKRLDIKAGLYLICLQATTTNAGRNNMTFHDHAYSQKVERRKKHKHAKEREMEKKGVIIYRNTSNGNTRNTRM
jgi:hypothetical protein